MTTFARLAIAALALLGGSAAAARLRPVPGSSPTNGQECASDLSDPGGDGVIRIRYRIPPRRLALLDDGSLLTFRDQEGAAVPCERDYDPVARILEVRPGLPMLPGQYTLDMDARLLGRKSRPLGRSRGYSTSFTVGPDFYPPVLLGTRPVQARIDVPRTAAFVASFSESLDPGSAILGETVLVENLSVQPPRPIPGTVFLDRQGFDLVFRPAGAMPAAAIVGVRLLGAGNGNFVRDLAGNGLEGVPADGNEVRVHFSTRLR